MRYIVVVYLIFQTHFIFSQDSLSIFLKHPNDQLDLLVEGIQVSGSSVTYFKVFGDDFDIRLKLERYTKTVKFLQELVTERAVRQIYLSGNGANQSHASTLEVIFVFYYGKAQKDYSFYMSSKPKKNIVWRVITFWKRFLVEHGCKDSYQVHRVRKNETISSIARNYSLDPELLALFNDIYFDILRQLNNKLMDVLSIYEGKKKLLTNDKLLIPCLPKKVSKYE
ncbi:LysM peptidoglycan-binding domain-containing protein [Microscilla marina]|uniref:LysM domain-containing protein n=1 Tax=Microscilla marina ATCC 23134 TaxID=313606 RepID=A1ZUY3_MICM2|nr:LysM domain-containing protein [Microscilla marina]EAY25761.1 hypothetical protein M23134_03335 [Microscilla marina ATCC 23134]